MKKTTRGCIVVGAATLWLVSAGALAQEIPVPAAQPARFAQDKWVYFQSVARQGTPAETRSGTLRYDGKDVAAPEIFDYVQTPWGTMYWWGDNARQGRSGWLLSKPSAQEIGKQVQPDAKTAHSDEIDLSRTRTYARRQWRYEYEVTLLASGQTLGKGQLTFADKPVQAGGLRDYVRTPWGVMYYWGDEKGNAGEGYRGWVPKIAIGRPGRLIRVESQRIEHLDLGKSNTYESGHWQYSYDIHAKGTRSEGRMGKLSYKGRDISAQGVGDYVRTPWGVMFWWGKKENRWGNQGWLPTITGAQTGKLINPTDEQQQIDLTRPRAYEQDGWSFVYTIWARGEASEGSAGQLYYKNEKVQAKNVGDFVQTPWGRMHYHGPMGVDLKGPHGWLPVPTARAGGNPVDPTEADARKIDLQLPATYTAGHWKYSYTLWRPGTAGQGRLGQLRYEDRQVEAKRPGDVIQTPWGRLWWWGQLDDALRGDYGWLPIEPEEASKDPVLPPDPSGLDLTQPRTFQKDRWKYVFLTWGQNTPHKGQSGRLYYASVEVKADSVGDFVVTPWGKMYYWSVPTHTQGNQGWLPIEPPGGQGKQIEVTRSREKIDLSVPGGYSFSQWRYVYAVWAPGTRSEGAFGELFHRGSLIRASQTGDWVDSPWGKLYYHGPLESTFGRHGWMPVATETLGKQIHLDAEAGDPSEPAAGGE